MPRNLNLLEASWEPRQYVPCTRQTQREPSKGQRVRLGSRAAETDTLNCSTCTCSSTGERVVWWPQPSPHRLPGLTSGCSDCTGSSNTGFCSMGINISAVLQNGPEHHHPAALSSMIETLPVCPAQYGSH